MSTSWNQPDFEGHLVTQHRENKRGHLGVIRGDLYSLAWLGPWGATAWGRATPCIPWPSLGPLLAVIFGVPVWRHVAQAPAANLPYFPLTKFPCHLFFSFLLSCLFLICLFYFLFCLWEQI